MEKKPIELVEILLDQAGAFDEMKAERTRQKVNRRVMRREMERNPTRKFFPKRKKSNARWPLGFGFDLQIKEGE